MAKQRKYLGRSDGPYLHNNFLFGDAEYMKRIARIMDFDPTTMTVNGRARYMLLDADGVEDALFAGAIPASLVEREHYFGLSCHISFVSGELDAADDARRAKSPEAHEKELKALRGRLAVHRARRNHRREVDTVLRKKQDSAHEDVIAICHKRMELLEAIRSRTNRPLALIIASGLALQIPRFLSTRLLACSVVVVAGLGLLTGLVTMAIAIVDRRRMWKSMPELPPEGSCDVDASDCA